MLCVINILSAHPLYAALCCAIYAADPLVRIAGWYKSFGDAWAAAKVGFDTGMPGNQISKIEYNAYRSAGDDINHTIFGRSMQRLYRAAQLPSRFLLGGDEFFKVLSQNGELFTAAHRQMKAAQAILTRGSAAYICFV